MEHTSTFASHAIGFKEHRMIYQNGPENPEAAHEQPKPDNPEDARKRTEKKVEGMSDDDLDEIQRQREEREKVREIDDKVDDEVGKVMERVFKDKAELEKAINDLIAQHIGDYKGLKPPSEIRKDITSTALYSVRNFPMKGMDQVCPRYTFDDNNRITLSDVTLVENTPENVRKQAEQALEFMKGNIKDAKNNTDLLNKLTFPLENFRLLNSRQQLAVANRALEWLKKQDSKKTDIPRSRMIRPELVLVDGRYVIPGIVGEYPGTIRPDHEVWTLGMKKEKEK